METLCGSSVNYTKYLVIPDGVDYEEIRIPFCDVDMASVWEDEILNVMADYESVRVNPSNGCLLLLYRLYVGILEYFSNKNALLLEKYTRILNFLKHNSRNP